MDQQIDKNIVMLEEKKSVYSILATYFNNAEKNGLYVRGHIDGESAYDAFIEEFNRVCKTKFIIRTSWRKTASALPRRSRYGKEERVYWEYNSGNLTVPFTGVPFIVRSCLTKHCQYGSHYYKTTAERVTKQLQDHQNDPSVAPPEVKRRRNKPSKKRNCPAIMHVREIIMFPDFGLDLKRMFDTKYHVRQEKTQLIFKLKEVLNGSSMTPLNGLIRFYISLPLPEVHIGHPEPCGGIGPTIHPSVTAKIDELLSLGIYDARHVRIIVHDYVREILMKQDTAIFPNYFVLYPTEHDIADYIYVSSITVKPTVIVENDEYSSDSGVRGEMEGSICELMNLIQNCPSDEALKRAQTSMKKIIETVKTNSDDKQISKHNCSRPVIKTTNCSVNENTSLTDIVILHEENASLSTEHLSPGEQCLNVENAIQSCGISLDSFK